MNEANYYEFLNLDPNTFPKHDSKENKVLLKQILDRKFQELAPIHHPDRGGDPEIFKFLLRSITVLGDENLRKQYDGEEASIFSKSQFDIDWTKYFTYNSESTAGVFGNNFVQKLKTILNVPLLSAPKLPEDGYHWVFDFKSNDVALTFSIVYDEDEVLALTNGEDFTHSMPFKLYLYFPSRSLKRELDYTNAVKMPDVDDYFIYPKLKSISYEDLVLLQTTNQNIAISYLKENFENDIEKIVQNKFVGQILPNNLVKKTVTETELKEHDKSVLSKLFAIKTPRYEENEKGADFIKDIQVKPIKRITTQVIKKKNSN